MILLNIDKIIVIGDRVLVKPSEESNKTTSGLYLPPNVLEKERVQTGYVIKAGPGYPVAAAAEDDEPWKEKTNNTKYISLQAREGDLALFLKKDAIEIEVEREKLLIVPQNAILLLFREDPLGNL